MYRPLTYPVTWAAGAASEDVVMGNLDMADPPVPNGMLITDAQVSSFIVDLIDELGYERVRSVASGNRAMMLVRTAQDKHSAHISSQHCTTVALRSWLRLHSLVTSFTMSIASDEIPQEASTKCYPHGSSRAREARTSATRAVLPSGTPRRRRQFSKPTVIQYGHIRFVG
jgi:hypothetical protein